VISSGNPRWDLEPWSTIAGKLGAGGDRFVKSVITRDFEQPERPKLKFCLVTTYYPPYHFGGDAVFVQCLARALSARGHSVEVVHCEDAYRVRAGAVSVPAEPTDDGVVVHRLHSRWGVLSPLVTQQTSSPGLRRSELMRLLGRGFDVVNFHNISLLGGLGVFELAPVPVRIYTLHEHWLLCPTSIFWKNRKQACDVPECLQCSLRSGIPPQLWRYSSLIQRSLAQVDVLLSPSTYTARRHAEAGIEAVRVLPTFTNLDDGERTFVPPDRPRFVFSGRVTASKGIVGLVETFSGLPGFDLDVVGDGDLLEPLRRRFAHCGWIRFSGRFRHESMAQYYRDATAMILPSLAPEVFPLCVLEAFACGTPAIVHDAGGAGEAVQSSGAGFVYRGQTQLQEAIERLAGDPELRRALGRLARAAYLTRYTEEHYMGGFLDIVNEIYQSKLATEVRT
jgi:glycosyltransferase involved in cell wall biosynthesis